MAINFAILGNYNGNAAPMQPLWQHIASANGAAALTMSSGAVSDACKVNASGILAVAAATKGVSAVVLVLGGDCHEGEGTDRDFLHLPGSQSQLFKAVLAATTAAKQKLIVVRHRRAFPVTCIHLGGLGQLCVPVICD